MENVKDWSKAISYKTGLLEAQCLGNITRHTHECFRHVPAGTVVGTGYSGIYVTAPSEEGMYTLWDVADTETNSHLYFMWEKENAQTR